MGFTIMGQLHGQAESALQPRPGHHRHYAAIYQSPADQAMSADIYEQIRLAKQGDKETAGKLVEENSGLIWSVARRYFGRGVDPEDLYQLAVWAFSRP